MANEKIFDNNDMKMLVSIATNEFSPSLKEYYQQYNTRLDFILTQIKMLQEQTNIRPQLYKRGQGNIFYKQLNEQNNQIYVKLTQVYYLLRTFLTGETISFLEEIDGHLRVIDQYDWLKNLTGTNQTEYGTSHSAIFLLEKSIKDLGTSIEESDKFSKIANYDTIVEQVIQAATFTWSEDNKEPVGTTLRGKHNLYQKDSRDTWVYAYYTGGKKRKLQLLYQAIQKYNLGWIQEELVKRMEQSVIDQMQESFIQSLQGEHPVAPVLANWKMSNVPGLVEGDLRTAQGEWIQSKRHNEQVIKTLQIHNAIVQVAEYLTDLKNALNQNIFNQHQTIEVLTDKFYKLFSSDTEKINNNLKNKIREQLKLMGQSII